MALRERMGKKSFDCILLGAVHHGVGSEILKPGRFHEGTLGSAASQHQLAAPDELRSAHQGHQIAAPVHVASGGAVRCAT